ncbi:FHY3/FAR1 family protein [Dioscorea alata]|uniref:FHY3/FAR1 family protein n=1 Tax=Dioscorea alata TaxID=55571 RepID=A0ACB7WDF6_DIOAL|nr:FHY3/FAR1 family protein [Dioscorea alata]
MGEVVLVCSEQGKDNVEVGCSNYEIHGKEKPVDLDLVENIVPEAGMILDSKEEVYKLYIQYARREGFGSTKKSTRLGDDEKLKYYTLACVRVNCPAKINIIVSSDGRFTISSVNLEHNHALSPQKARFQKCNKKIDAYVKRRLELNDQARISLSKNFHSLAVESGGYENLTYTEKDCRKYIAKARQFRLGVGDVVALGKYFSRMQQRNTKFFHLIDIDEEGCLRNVFWVDARSIAAYEAFGDYDMPFAPFVRINHHEQTEDTETYIWLFKIWLKCMSGKVPIAILTDQCMAIQGAVRMFFSNSHHRLCLWHIMKKVPEKLGGLNKYKAIKKILKRITYEAVDTQEFEDTYLKMLADYNIEKNEWLNSLFKIHDHWAPVYVRGIFWAGMSSTQRNESVNSFFDGYVGPTTSLKQFIEKENKADFASFNSCFPLITDCYFEKQLQEAYTNEIFKLFQDELLGMIYFNLTLTGSHGAVCSFQVSDVVKGKEGAFRKQVVYNVYTNAGEFDIKCSYRLFEFKGIICRHICKVLIEKNVQDIPSRYILPRWRKDIKRMHTYVQNCYDDPQTSEEKLRYNKLCSHLLNKTSNSFP